MRPAVTIKTAGPRGRCAGSHLKRGEAVPLSRPGAVNGPSAGFEVDESWLSTDPFPRGATTQVDRVVGSRGLVRREPREWRRRLRHLLAAHFPL